MNKTLGMILIALGLVGLVWGGFTYTTREKVVDLGPIDISPAAGVDTGGGLPMVRVRALIIASHPMPSVAVTAMATTMCAPGCCGSRRARARGKRQRCCPWETTAGEANFP